MFFLFFRFQLEKTLAFKEEQTLEKDLILDQVSRLVSRVNARVDTGKADTVGLAKKVKSSDI